MEFDRADAQSKKVGKYNILSIIFCKIFLIATMPIFLLLNFSYGKASLATKVKLGDSQMITNLHRIRWCYPKQEISLLKGSLLIQNLALANMSKCSKIQNKGVAASEFKILSLEKSIVSVCDCCDWISMKS